MLAVVLVADLPDAVRRDRPRYAPGMPLKDVPLILHLALGARPGPRRYQDVHPSRAGEPDGGGDRHLRPHLDRRVTVEQVTARTERRQPAADGREIEHRRTQALL